MHNELFHRWIACKKVARRACHPSRLICFGRFRRHCCHNHFIAEARLATTFILASVEEEHERNGTVMARIYPGISREVAIESGAEAELMRASKWVDVDTV